MLGSSSGLQGRNVLPSSPIPRKLSAAAAEAGTCEPQTSWAGRELRSIPVLLTETVARSRRCFPASASEPCSHRWTPGAPGPPHRQVKASQPSPPDRPQAASPPLLAGRGSSTRPGGNEEAGWGEGGLADPDLCGAAVPQKGFPGRPGTPVITHWLCVVIRTGRRIV